MHGAKGNEYRAMAGIACDRDAAPVLESPDHALDQITLPVNFGVVGDRLLSALASGNAGRGVRIGQSRAESSRASKPLSAIKTSAFVSFFRTVAALRSSLTMTLIYYQYQWLDVKGNVQLGAWAAFGPCDRLNSRNLAAVRCDAMRCALR
jgi:hypothetical protein